MFLHTGNNNLVPLKDIVAIFDSEVLKKSNVNEKYLTDQRTTILLCKDKKEEILYTNISAQTMLKRIHHMEAF